MNSFELFLSQLHDTNFTLADYTDFNKCSQAVSRIAVQLNTLNYLIGQPNMEEAIKVLWDNDPRVFSALDILIAVRKSDHKMVLGEDRKPHTISSFLQTPDGVAKFITDTGLRDILANRQIKNLVDYVFGVEVGLDSNARKNRSGEVMGNIVSSCFTHANLAFEREVRAITFPTIARVLGKDIKRFDFVVRNRTTTFLVEVNFYSSGGSKLNEVARAYSDIAPKINSADGFQFVWITDGKGWHKAKNQLEEAFRVIPMIFNLTTIHNFIDIVQKGK